MTSTLPAALAHAASLDDDALIDLILTYHSAHLRDLAAAIPLAEHVREADGGSGEFPKSLPELLLQTRDELAAHQVREETLFFPAILAEGGENLALASSGLGREHDEAQTRLEQLVRLTQDFTPPPSAGAEWRRLYDICRDFDRDFRVHAQLEERVLFPRLIRA